MAKKPRQGMVVTLSGKRAVHLVKRDLESAGLTEVQVLDAIKPGVVTGNAHPAAAEKLRKVNGVADVSADHPVDIGPGDSDVQ